MCFPFPDLAFSVLQDGIVTDAAGNFVPLPNYWAQSDLLKLKFGNKNYFFG